MFAMLLMNDYPVLVTATVIIAAFLAKIIHKTFKSRRAIGKLPGPPHSLIFGHLLAMGKITEKLPKRVHPHVYPYYCQYISTAS
jgi:hypothetical protein